MAYFRALPQARFDIRTAGHYLPAIMADQETAEAIPTGTIEDRVAEYLDTSDGSCTFVFKNPEDKKFALKFDVKILVVLNKMCASLLSRWHRTREDKGTFFRHSGEATVSAFNDLRGFVAIQFDHDIAHLLPMSTALELSQLIIQTVERSETPAERAQRLKKQSKMIITPPGQGGIIRP